MEVFPIETRLTAIMKSQFARKKLQGRDIQNLNIQAIRCLM